MSPTLQKMGVMIAGNLLSALVIDLTAYKSSRDAAGEAGKPPPAFDFVTFAIRMLIAAATGALTGGGWAAATQQ